MSHDESVYGRALAHAGSLDFVPCIDAAVEDGKLYAIGGGELIVASLEDPLRPRIIGRCRGLGNVRQVEVVGRVAYITARDDGLFIVDMEDTARPAVLSHYDTLEKATGVSVAPPLAAVVSRYHGAELIDVSDPRRPRYLASVGAGKELQSVDISSTYLYAGAWNNRELVIADIKDPTSPFVVGLLPLDGYGDGVCVHGGLCFCATGHHSRLYRGQHYLPPEHGNAPAGYGEGHGIEIFDVTRPAQGRFLARLKTPRLYSRHPDMWGVQAAGDYAILADNENGLFIVDARDPSHPRFGGHAVLPQTPDGRPDTLTGVALNSGHVYAAGFRTGLHVYAAPGFAFKPGSRSLATGAIRRTTPPVVSRDGIWTVYHAGGQVRAAVPIGTGSIAVAAGMAGIHVVTVSPSVERLQVLSTEETVMDVAFRDGVLFAAEGRQGVSMWKADADGRWSFLSRYARKGISVDQVVAPPSSRYLLLQDAPSGFEIVDMVDPGNPTSVLADRVPGIFYLKSITPELIDGRYASFYWHFGGPIWYDLASATPTRVSDIKESEGNVINGMAVVKGRFLVLCNNGYALLSPGTVATLHKLRLSRLAGNEPMTGGERVETIGSVHIRGVASIYGTTLLTAASAWSAVKAVDISDLDRPKVIEKIYTPGNPDRVTVVGTTVLIPDGNAGLRVANKPEWFVPTLTDALSLNDIPLALGARTGILSLPAMRCADGFPLEQMPPALSGQTYLCIRRGEQTVRAPGYAFCVNRRVTVHLLVSEHGGFTPPGWRKTGMRARWRDAQGRLVEDTIYARDFEAGPIVIPPHEGRSADNCFGIPHSCVVAAR